MSWSNAYIGLRQRDLGRDRSGVDCWGLAYLVYGDLLHIDLPLYRDYACASEKIEAQAQIDDACGSPLWRRVERAQPFDIAVFYQGRFRSHVGVIVRGRHMLHVAAQEAARIERFDRPPWHHRLDGFYRYAGAADLQTRIEAALNASLKTSKQGLA